MIPRISALLRTGTDLAADSTLVLDLLVFL